MWAQIVNCVLGIWLMFAPAVLGHSGALLAKFDRTAGPWIAAVAFVSISQISRSTRWLSLPASAVLIVAPLFLDAPGIAQVNSIIVGVVTASLTPLGSPDQRKYGNGWTTLWRDDELPGFDAPSRKQATGT